MSGAISPLPQYAFMAWCSVKAQGQLYLLPYLYRQLPFIKNYPFKVILTFIKTQSFDDEHRKFTPSLPLPTFYITLRSNHPVSFLRPASLLHYYVSFSSGLLP
jgi:hypothetical protein